MRTFTRSNLLGLILLTSVVVGCDAAVERESPHSIEKGSDKSKSVETKKVLMGENIFLEVTPDKKRRVVVSGEICLREGQLELLMCKKHTKEHEAIITADVDARKVHLALIAAGATEGSPVQFAPKYRPASGTRIKVSVQYKDKDKLMTVPAQEWIKNAKDGKPLKSDWVFAGSRLVTNPLDPDKKHYLANDGDVICVSNFESALLDLPILSPKDDAERFFIANTERIPELTTKVAVLLEPVIEEKKDKK